MKNRAHQIVSGILRPPRVSYDPESLPFSLPPSDPGAPPLLRHHITYRSARGASILGSLYHRADIPSPAGGPCVVYVHGLWSSQLEARFLVPNLCRHSVHVFAFDMLGCGRSSGEYVPAGDAAVAATEELLAFLRTSFRLGPFVVWGRGFGGGVALCLRSARIVGRIVDSAFSSTREMLAHAQRALGLAAGGALADALGFFLRERMDAGRPLEPVDAARAIDRDCPVIFRHSADDEITPMSQGAALFEECASAAKYLMTFTGPHDKEREDEWLQLAITFVLERFSHFQRVTRVLRPAESEAEGAFAFATLGELFAQCGDAVGASVIDEYRRERGQPKRQRTRGGKRQMRRRVVRRRCAKTQTYALFPAAPLVMASLALYREVNWESEARARIEEAGALVTSEGAGSAFFFNPESAEKLQIRTGQSCV